jgi:hypothetical protein
VWLSVTSQVWWAASDSSSSTAGAGDGSVNYNDGNNALTLISLSAYPAAVCNDGSPAGWVDYVEGVGSLTHALLSCQLLLQPGHRLFSVGRVLGGR